jgi:prepilin peptidase CpaA
MMIEAIVLMLFPALMIYCAANDLVSMTIPNIVSIVAVCVFPALAMAAGLDLQTIGWHLLCGATVLAVTFALFAFGIFGGGDAKMTAAAAVWLGFDQILAFSLGAAVLGGFLTLGLLSARAYPWPVLVMRVPWIARLTNEKEGIPYGVALGAAALILYPNTAIWHAATGIA